MAKSTYSSNGITGQEVVGIAVVEDKRCDDQSIFLLITLLPTVSIYSVCYNQNTIRWVAYKQHAFISHSSEGWEIQDHGADLSFVCKSPLSGSLTAIFSFCPHMAKAVRDLFRASL